LIAAGADVNVKDENGLTALMMASIKGLFLSHRFFTARAFHIIQIRF